jgi:hypothetical protein
VIRAPGIEVSMADPAAGAAVFSHVTLRWCLRPRGVCEAFAGRGSIVSGHRWPSGWDGLAAWRPRRRLVCC